MHDKELNAKEAEKKKLEDDFTAKSAQQKAEADAAKKIADA